MRFFYFLFLLFVFSHLYIFIAMRRVLGGGWWQLPAGLWLICMAFSWLLRMSPSLRPLMAPMQAVVFVWMGFSIMLCYCLLAADAAMLLARAAAFIGRAEILQRFAAFMTGKRCLPLAFAAGVALFGYALYEAQNFRVVRLDIATPKLPAGSAPLRIVGIADIHVSELIGPWMLERMQSLVAEQNPDIIVVAGDTVDIDLSARTGEARILRGFPARLGKFAVTGNHESYRGLAMSLNFLERAGFRVLRGESVEVGGISIGGVDDDSFQGQFTPDTTDVSRVVPESPGERFFLLLNHKPRVDQNALGRFDLQFSGHTHGGQIWPGRYMVRSIYGAPQGLSPLGDGKAGSLLFLTNGLGFWGPPVRLGARPEIVVITLTPA